jgi:hypothetical protein
VILAVVTAKCHQHVVLGAVPERCRGVQHSMVTHIHTYDHTLWASMVFLGQCMIGGCGHWGRGVWGGVVTQQHDKCHNLAASQHGSTTARHNLHVAHNHLGMSLLAKRLVAMSLVAAPSHSTCHA